MKLFIATPTADGIMLPPYVASLVGLVGHLRTSGIQAVYRSLAGRDLILQRNRLCDEFLASDCTHLLFIDNDMAFPPDLCSRLLAAGKDLVGAVYSKRTLDLGRFKRLAAAHAFDEALALAYEWNLEAEDGRLNVKGGFAPVLALPGGFLIIARAVLDKMASRGEAPYPDPAGRSPVRAFFREQRDGGRIIEGDYAFCRRWVRLGGEVWAYVEAEIRHIGDFRAAPGFGVSLESLKAAQAAR